jgi:hypothetical protein
MRRRVGSSFVAAARPARLAGCHRTLGTTLAPWGLAFIQSYAVTSGSGRRICVRAIDVFGGALLTEDRLLHVIACAATLNQQGQ